MADKQTELTLEEISTIIFRVLEEEAKEAKLKGDDKEGFMLMYSEGLTVYNICYEVAKEQAAQLKSQDVCLEPFCDRGKVCHRDNEWEDCPTCQGKRQDPDREKIAEYLYNENESTLIYDGVTFEKCKEIYPDKTDSYLNQADQILTLLTDVRKDEK